MSKIVYSYKLYGTIFVYSLDKIEEFLKKSLSIEYSWNLKTVDWGISFTIYSNDDDLIEHAEGLIKKEFGNFVRFNNKLPGDILLDLLKEKQFVFAAAESCTGGLIAKHITDFSGSSKFFWGSLITYHNQAKVDMLGVKQKTLDMYGAVSGETVTEMALGVLNKSKANAVISVSGIAGPEGGTKQKPVGTVWFCAAKKNEAYCNRVCFSGNRSEVRKRSASYGIIMIEQFIRGVRLDSNNYG